MKKIVSLILAAAMLLACSVCFAEGETVMHVGTNPEFAPFEYVDDNGEIAGIDVDIMNEIGKDLGVTIEMQGMEFDALVPSLASGKLDATIAGMSITDERKQSWNYIKAILERYEREGVRSLADIQASEQQHQAARQQQGRKAAKAPVPEADRQPEDQAEFAARIAEQDAWMRDFLESQREEEG